MKLEVLGLCGDGMGLSRADVGCLWAGRGYLLEALLEVVTFEKASHVCGHWTTSGLLHADNPNHEGHWVTVLSATCQRATRYQRRVVDQ